MYITYVYIYILIGWRVLSAKALKPQIVVWGYGQKRLHQSGTRICAHRKEERIDADIIRQVLYLNTYIKLVNAATRTKTGAKMPTKLFIVQLVQIFVTYKIIYTHN